MIFASSEVGFISSDMLRYSSPSRLRRATTNHTVAAARPATPTAIRMYAYMGTPLSATESPSFAEVVTAPDSEEADLEDDFALASLEAPLSEEVSEALSEACESGLDPGGTAPEDEPLVPSFDPL